jgi:hypothetical protein
LKVLEKRELRKLFRLERVGVREGLREMSNEKLSNWHFTPDISGVFK